MPDLNHPLLVITGLEGALLDHDSGNWQPAADWIKRLKEKQVPLICCSGKTAAEILPLQDQLGIAGTPFIAEHGAVIQLSASSRPPAVSYSRLVTLLDAMRPHFRFRGFSDFTDAQIAEMTGLALAQAALARQREASEVIVWQDSPELLDTFRDALATHSLRLIQGGRFWHIIPAGQDKGLALDWLLSHLSSQSGHSPQTIGLGDGPDDVPMLERVDFAVIIRGYSKFPVSLTRTDTPRTYHTAQYGSRGWSEGLDYFLQQRDHAS